MSEGKERESVCGWTNCKNVFECSANFDADNVVALVNAKARVREEAHHLCRYRLVSTRHHHQRWCVLHQLLHFQINLKGQPNYDGKVNEYLGKRRSGEEGHGLKGIIQCAWNNL